MRVRLKFRTRVQAWEPYRVRFSWRVYAPSMYICGHILVSKTRLAFNFMTRQLFSVHTPKYDLDSDCRAIGMFKVRNACIEWYLVFYLFWVRYSEYSKVFYAAGISRWTLRNKSGGAHLRFNWWHHLSSHSHIKARRSRDGMLVFCLWPALTHSRR